MAWHHHFKTVHEHASAWSAKALRHAAEHHPVLATGLTLIGVATVVHFVHGTPTTAPPATTPTK